MTALVTVGMPTYNRADRLRRAAESVLGQTYPNLDLLISDNGSTDGTEKLGRALAAADPRVRYVRQPANRGPAANFQYVLDHARGDYFLWLADDDWLDPGYVARCAAELDRCPEVKLAAGAARYYRAGAFAYPERPLAVEAPTPAGRVTEYFRRVADNGVFYGLARRRDVAGRHLPDGLGGDWVWVAQLAWAGPVRTLPDVHVHRSADGACSDMRRLAVRSGCPGWLAWGWEMYLAWNVARLTAGGFDARPPLPAAARRRLAARALVVLLARLVPAMVWRHVRPRPTTREVM